MSSFPVRVGGGAVSIVRPVTPEALPTALAEAGLRAPSPVVVVVGGAGGLDDDELRRMSPVFSVGLVKAIEQAGAVAVDGGTDAGVMRLLGRARMAASAAFRLVGVAAEGTVRVPGAEPVRGDAMDLESHHTDFVLVPGDDWGIEASWIALTATCLAGLAPSVTVLVNGGDIAYRDAQLSIEAGRAVIVVAGSGRAADEISAAVRGEPSDPRAREVASSGLVSYVDAGDPSRLCEAVTAALVQPTR